MISAAQENDRDLIVPRKSTPKAKSPFKVLNENDSLKTSRTTGCAKKLSLQMAEAATPVPKRVKESMELKYPDDQDVPSRKSIRAHYESAMQLENSHQSSLSPFGLLSLEEVLLPAVVKEELKSIKNIQAKAQRDAPELVEGIMKLRCTIYEATEAGIEAGRVARAQRETEQVERDRQKEQSKLREKEERRIQRVEAKQAERERQFRESKKKLPKNMELWREVAFLMTELSNLQKEEHSWNVCLMQLNQKEQEMVNLQQNKPFEADDSDTKIEPNDFKDRIDSAVQDILLCARRIQNAVELTSKTIEDSSKVRKDLYQEYRADHQFHGYKGVKNPKGLIRALSQSQDAYDN